MGVDVFPQRRPAGGGQQKGTQSEHRLRAGARPFHAAAAETGFDRLLARAFVTPLPMGLARASMSENIIRGMLRTKQPAEASSAPCALRVRLPVALKAWQDFRERRPAHGIDRINEPLFAPQQAAPFRACRQHDADSGRSVGVASNGKFHPQSIPAFLDFHRSWFV